MAHILIVVILLFTVFERLVFQGWLPLWLDRICAALLWVWFINLFNFMDGIDGISGVQTMSIGMGSALLAGALGSRSLRQEPCASASRCGCWVPMVELAAARVFLGDVGKRSPRVFVGVVLLNLAVNG